MSTSRSLYQAIGMLKGAGSVVKESWRIIQTETTTLRDLAGKDALYENVKAQSEMANANFDYEASDLSNGNSQVIADGEVDIFVAARTKSKHVKSSSVLGSSTRPGSPKFDSSVKEPTVKRQFSTLSFLLNKNDTKFDPKEGKVIGEADKPKVTLSQSPVPSGKLQRLFHYGSLAASVGLNIVKEGAKKYAEGERPSLSKLIMSPRNVDRMARKLSRMRGAALKIGQMLSFQDSAVLPKEVAQILMKVQNNAQYMPEAQLEKTISFELGTGWRQRLFASFDDVPIAAASIGQVHRAVTRKGLEEVVVKVQYPGVADSIDSDLDTILMLLTASRMLPPGLFLKQSVADARIELKWECDYIREARNIERFQAFLEDDNAFVVPKVFHELSDEHVLTMQMMKGTEIVKGEFDQATKNWICENIMRLCLNEIYNFKFMQTDPNWANFLYNAETHKIELLDFGACRDFPAKFVKNYANCLRAAVRQDRKKAEEYSLKLGYLTGLESPEMTAAHIDSMMALGEPFCPSKNEGHCFNFSHQTVTDRVRGKIGLMLNERLTPPPEETYSLHRKLSGAYLLCARMNASIPCEKLFEDIIGLEYEK